jgi:hypothetical protein
MASSFINDAIINTHINNSSCNLAIGLKISGKDWNNNSNNTDIYDFYGIGFQLFRNTSNDRELAIIDTSNFNKIRLGITSSNTSIISVNSNNDKILPLIINSNLIITSNNVGIGTTNPQSNLHIIGDVGIHGSLNLNNKPLSGISDLNTSNLNSSGTIIANNITISGSFSNINTGVFKTSQWSNVITNPDNLYYSIGNVGINIQNPTEKLEVDGNIKLYNDDILGIKRLLRNDGTEIAQWSLNNNNVSILNNVGIGTVNTTSILNLNSNLSGCNMNIRFTDSSTGTTENDGILFGKDSNNNAFIRNLENRDIYFSAGDNCNATERMRIQASSGFIGIGTTNPTVALDILNGTLKTSNIRTDLIQNLNGTASILSITGNNATLALGTGNITSTGSISANNFILNGQSIVNAWNKEALNTNAIYYSNTINDNRVGIGTTVSISILHLHSNLSGCNMNIRFTDSSTGTTENDGILFGKDNINNAFIRNLENRDIYFGAGDNCNATERIRIQASSGFIGIGTTNPFSNLDIRGNLILPNDGNRIGIGTTNPTVALDILNGTLKTSNIRTDLIQNLNGTASILTVTGNNATIALGTGNITSTGSISANNFILNGASIVNAWNKEALNTNAIYYSNVINDNRVGIGTTVSISIIHLHSNLSGCNMNIRFTDSSTGTTENDGILFGKDNINS